MLIKHWVYIWSSNISSANPTLLVCSGYKANTCQGSRKAMESTAGGLEPQTPTTLYMAPASNAGFIFNLRGLIWTRLAAGCEGACRWSNHLARIEASAVVRGSQSIWRVRKSSGRASHRPRISPWECPSASTRRRVSGATVDWVTGNTVTTWLSGPLVQEGPLEAISDQLAVRVQPWNPPPSHLRRGAGLNGCWLTPEHPFVENSRKGESKVCI